MPEVLLSAGPIEYGDTGGDKPIAVLLHGLTIDSSVWRNVLPRLRADYRCITPTLPLGSHRRAMRPDADLSLRGMALLVEEFLRELGLTDVTLVLNDWGGAQLLLSEQRTERIARVALVACEAFDNYPPGAAGRLLTVLMKIPGGLGFLLWALRFRFVQRAPGGWGWMSKRPVPAEVMANWFGPARQDKSVRRDLVKYALSAPPKAELLELAERMRSFRKPVLVAWASEDKLMPREHGPRLVELFDDARLVTIPDSYTLVPEDQPELLADTLNQFIVDTSSAPGQ